MAQSVGYSEVCRMLEAAARQIQTHHEHLSRLDSAVGDGDHGTTILRAMEAVTKAAAEHPPGDLKSLFSSIAWAVMSCDGGSTGPLLGSFFQGLSEAPELQPELSPAALAAVLVAGIQKLQKQSRAQVGDKTMMDAFLPAAAALKAADPVQGAAAMLKLAANAAAQGAEATRGMRAKFGRARNLGDRVIGHPDPGAVSVSLILKGFSEALA
jgi:phosphoenolpyruvate---glycerone phosphotransferase subunit DhaL